MAEEEESEEEDDVPAPKHAGFAALMGDDDEDESEDEDEEQVANKGSGFAALMGGSEEEEEEEEEEGGVESGGQDSGLLVGVLKRVKKHKSADRLRVLEVDVGFDCLQVVTNAPNVAKGLRTVVAPPGSTIPRSGVEVGEAELRGVLSSGMLVSAYDLGWSEEDTGTAVELEGGEEPGSKVVLSSPLAFSLGSPAPAEDEAGETRKKKKKKKDKAESPPEVEAAAEHEPAEMVMDPSIFGKKKKSKKKLKEAAATAEGDSETLGSPVTGESGESSIVLDPSVFGKKKKSKKKAKEAPEAVGDPDPAAGTEGTSPEGGEQGGGSPEEKKSKKKKSKKKLKEGGDDAEGGEGREQDAQVKDDIAAILASLDAPKEASGGSKKKKKKGAAERPQRTAQDEEDIDAILAAIGDAPPPPEEEAPAEAAPAPEPEPEEPKELTAAQKKKLKKKQKDKERKAAAKEGGDSVKKPAGKAPTAAVRRMQEQLEAMKLAEAEAEAAEAERLRLIEEEEAQLAEEERLKQEKIRLKKEQKKARIERMKAEGTYLTGKEKEESRRREAMREQLLKSAGVAAEDLDSSTTKKVVYGKKKRRGAAQAEIASQEEEEGEKEAGVVTGEEVDMEDDAEAPAVEVEEEDDDWEEKDWDEEVKKIDAGRGQEEEEESDDDASDEASDDDGMDDSESDSGTYYSDSDEEREAMIEAARERREARYQAALEARTPDNLRSPIVCILGHVDTGKTKLLDKIRGTNVQDGEAGGITQQIGATFIPGPEIETRTESVRKIEQSKDINIPALLVIDTPGHESFTNLRSRGSGLCDIAILVVDIMHGLEQQTIESLNMLRQRKTPFVIALNKIDRMYDWKEIPNGDVRTSLAQQPPHVVSEFKDRVQKSFLALNEEGLNVALYYENPDPRSFVNVVPTSAITGEGIPDMLHLLVDLTQSRMVERLMHVNFLQCTVLEVKKIDGIGTTIDVILINGVLREGDTIVVSGYDGPIVTNIRALLTPHPMREMRVKGSYLHHKEIQASQGVKICANGLENALAGTQCMVLGPDDYVEDLKEEVQSEVEGILSQVDKSGEGVCVQASTLGSLEALLEFLRSPAVKIPVSGISIGPVHKHDVMRASIMMEKKMKEYAVILAFDVAVTKEAREYAADTGVKIFTADIIYHLFDQFTAYMDQVRANKKKDVAFDATFPCVLSIMPQFVFNKKDPIVLGVEVLAGIAKVGTPLCIPTQGFIEIGRIVSLENNHKPVDKAFPGDKVAMKVQSTTALEASRMYGRHFDESDELVSRVSRHSIDLLKEHFRDELGKEDWKLMLQLKSLFSIQ
tara:strand:- start:1656 stop:5597 length:3942 start_codon:yes stop_codon:yes gene_type:complete